MMDNRMKQSRLFAGMNDGELTACLQCCGAGVVRYRADEIVFRQGERPTKLFVLLSGAVEIALGLGLVALPKERRRMSLLATTFLVAVFPGNISQYVNQVDGLGLDTDGKRLVRLLIEPLLWAAALHAGGRQETHMKRTCGKPEMALGAQHPRPGLVEESPKPRGIEGTPGAVDEA